MYTCIERMKSVFKVKFSDKGSNNRAKEEQAYVFFVDFMDECEGIICINTCTHPIINKYYRIGGETDCTLEDILTFTSGSSQIPPVGFIEEPKLIFLYSVSSTLPTSSTCDITLRLPTTHQEYDCFKQYMLLGIKGHDGFGGV